VGKVIICYIGNSGKQSTEGRRGSPGAVTHTIKLDDGCLNPWPSSLVAECADHLTFFIPIAFGIVNLRGIGHGFVKDRRRVEPNERWSKQTISTVAAWMREVHGRKRERYERAK